MKTVSTDSAKDAVPAHLSGIPRVSVVMSVYNGESHLREAVDSILNQSFTDFEFLIVNDGSTDKTVQILNSYKDPRIRIIHNSENIGLTKSLNKAIKAATGEYIARMDADDVSLPDRLEKQLHFMVEHPYLALLGTSFIQIDNRGKHKKIVHLPTGREEIRKRLMIVNAFCHSSVVVKKSVLLQVGGYNEDLEYAQDYDLWLKISDGFEMDNYPEVLHKWRYNVKSGISHTAKKEQEEFARKIKLTHFLRKINNGLLRYSDLKNLAKQNPQDSIVANLYFQKFEEVEKLEAYGEDDLTTYLHLQYLHSTRRTSSLNRLADYYFRKGKRSLAFMCWTESLRLDVRQGDVAEKVLQLYDGLKPNIPATLKNNDRAVSIIMPTYNRVETIQESIRSILEQDFADHEVIVINDGGDDKVQEVIDSFRSERIVYFKCEKNQGLASALNVGIRYAGGKYIAYCDDDDILYPDHLKLLVDYLEKNACDFVYANTKMVGGSIREGKFVKTTDIGIWDQNFNKERLLERNFISTLSIMHKKDIFKTAGLFNEDLEMSMDWEMWLRNSPVHRFGHISKFTSEYRIKDDNMTVTDRAKLRFYYHILRNYYSFYKGDVSLLKHWIESKDLQKARDILNTIIANYDGYFKTEMSIRELFHASYVLREEYFLRKIIIDYFQVQPRQCLSDLKHYGLYGNMVTIFPLFIKKCWNRYLPTRT